MKISSTVLVFGSRSMWTVDRTPNFPLRGGHSTTKLSPWQDVTADAVQRASTHPKLFYSKRATVKKRTAPMENTAGKAF